MWPSTSQPAKSVQKVNISSKFSFDNPTFFFNFVVSYQPTSYKKESSNFLFSTVSKMLTRCRRKLNAHFNYLKIMLELAIVRLVAYHTPVLCKVLQTVVAFNYIIHYLSHKFLLKCTFWHFTFWCHLHNSFHVLKYSI